MLVAPEHRSLPWRKETSRSRMLRSTAPKGGTKQPPAQTRRAEQWPRAQISTEGRRAEATAPLWQSKSPVTDEPPYPPGFRARISGSVAASAEDEAIAEWNRGGTLAGEAPPTPSGKVPHPAPRIKVDVLKISGRINEADVLRQARSKGYWPFRLCYEEGLRRSQKVHGTINVRVSVGASGAVRSAQKVAAEVDDPTVIGCVVKAARGLALPAPNEAHPR